MPRKKLATLTNKAPTISFRVVEKIVSRMPREIIAQFCTITETALLNGNPFVSEHGLLSLYSWKLLLEISTCVKTCSFSLRSIESPNASRSLLQHKDTEERKAKVSGSGFGYIWEQDFWPKLLQIEQHFFLRSEKPLTYTLIEWNLEKTFLIWAMSMPNLKTQRWWDVESPQVVFRGWVFNLPKVMANGHQTYLKFSNPQCSSSERR